MRACKCEVTCVFPKYYRPQRSCEGYVFTPVCHSVRGGEVPGQVPPWDQVHPHPPDKYTLRAGTTPRQIQPREPGTPPGQEHPLGRYTPLGRYIPQDQVHPRAGTPSPPGDGYCCGRYASYWNAFLFSLNSVTKIFVRIIKGLKSATSCVRDQDATPVPARQMLETWTLKWAQSMF